MVDWNFQLHEDFIAGRSDEVILERGIACPCRNGDQYAALIEREGKPANQRRLSCPQCRGDGFIYRDAKKIRGLLTSINPGRDRRLIESGYAVPGDMTFSPPPSGPFLTPFDKVTLLVPQPLNEGQVIMRGAAGLEENAQFVTDLATNEDRLWYEATCSIWCEDINGVIYSEGTDFTFKNHKIVWQGNAPDVGTLYTIKYLGYTEWVVYATPMDRVDNCRSLGQRVVLRKKHTAFMTDSANESAETRSVEEVSFTTRTKL